MGRIICVWAVVCLASTGCDGEGSGDGPPPDGGSMLDMAADGAVADAAGEDETAADEGNAADAEPEGPGCGDGPACDPPDECREARCVPPGGCLDDTDCPGDGVCRSGQCGPSGCVDDAECPAELVCADRRCVDPPECGPAAPCPGDAVCDDGACVDPGCAEDAECAADEVCRDAACVPACADDDACPGEAICVNRACAPPMCAADEECLPGEVCADGRCGPPPGPQACLEPGFMPDFGVYRGTTRDAPDEVRASCADGADAPEVVLRFQLERAADVCLSTMGSAYDSALHVRTVCADRATEVACRDDGFGRDPFQAQVRVAAEAGVDYFVFVDGFRGASGDYVLEFVDGPCPEEPPGPECVTDDDCGASAHCADGVCVPGARPE